jgi:hypothetical protein
LRILLHGNLIAAIIKEGGNRQAGEFAALFAECLRKNAASAFWMDSCPRIQYENRRNFVIQLVNLFD